MAAPWEKYAASGYMAPEAVAAGGKVPVTQKDGTLSTEKTITVEADGQHFIIPTIINGQSLTPDAAADAFMAKKIKPIASFGNAEDARRYAEQRSRDLDAAFGGTGVLRKGPSAPAQGAVSNAMKGPWDKFATKPEKIAADQVPNDPYIDPEKPETGIIDQIVGAGETALTLGTAATGGVAGQIAGTLKGLVEQILSGQFGTAEAAQAVTKAATEGGAALTYAPRTQAGQNQVKAVGEIASVIPPILPMAGELAAAGRMAAPAVALAGTKASQTAQAGAMRGAEAIRTGAGKVAEAVGMEPPVRAAGGSVGSAGVPMDMLRREKAAGLPVPIDLTEGAATRDAAQLAFEKEALKSPSMGAPLRARTEQNNLQALQNFDTLIDLSGAESPDLAATGSRLTKTLSEGYKAAKNKTNVAYRAARNSKEAEAPVDSGTVVRLGEGPDEVVGSVVSFINERPSGVSSVIDSARKYAVARGVAAEQDGKLVPKTTTVGAMEDFRRDLSQLAKFGDASGLREETLLKKIVDAQTEPVAGPLYKKARATRQEQGRKYENRVIVARLINNKRGMDDAQVPVDEVFRKTILNSSPEEITFLKRVLKTNGKAGEAAWRELEGETLKYIRDEATKGMGMDSADKPIVSPAKLHQAVSQLDKNGRLDLMLGKKNAQVVRDLNEVVRYVNTVPPGTLVNTSGTAGMLMAAIAEAGATGALTGLPVPVLSGLKLASKGIKDAKTRARIKKALGE